MKCLNCNAEISDNAKFCPECGSKVERVSHCSQCGTELASGAKFCPECGTPVNAGASVPAKPQQEDETDNFLPVSGEELDELIGKEHKLISIDSVYPEDDHIADVELYPSDDIADSGFVIIGKKRGNSTIFADFTYRGIRGRETFNATIAIEVTVKSNLEVEVKEYNFLNTDDEEGEKQSSVDWDKVGSFAKGAASFLGGFAAGALEGFLENLDDDDD
ncbi:MAG: zinc ribbon domain-containing protein [Prevotella sp.]|nr:zinc ribbon domain-containing protein [Prevotella sp.]